MPVTVAVAVTGSPPQSREGKDLNPYTEIYWRDLAKTGIGEDGRKMVKPIPQELRVDFFADFLKHESECAVESVGGCLLKSILNYVLQNEIQWRELAGMLLQKHEHN